MTPEAPYAVPKAGLTEPGSQKIGSPVKAVLVGVGVDVIGTIVSSLVISALYGVLWVIRGLPPEQIEQAINNSSQFSPFKLVLIAAGTAISILSGYLCARIAKRREYLWALITSVISVSAPLAMSGLPNGLDLKMSLMILLTLCASLTGAYIAVRRHNLGG